MHVDVETVLWILRTLGETAAIQMTVFLVYLIWSGRLVAGDRLEDVQKQVEETTRRAEEWRDLAFRSQKHEDPRKLKCGEDELGWDCRDTYDHAFCAHDCCADKDFCRAPEVDGARGYYKDVVGRDSNPPTTFWARVWWTKPSSIEVAKWNWDRRMEAIAKAKVRPRVFNLTIGPVLDLPSSDPQPWESPIVQSMKRIAKEARQPRRTEGTKVRWQGTTRPASSQDHEDDGQQRPGPGPSHR